MLTSINPLGERVRGHRWSVTVTVYLAASVLGGSTTGLILGSVGTVVHVPVRLAALACAVAALLDVVHRVPTVARQVDEDWLSRYRRWLYASGYGWQLGTGVLTIVTSAATYTFLLLLVAVGLPWGVVAGATFGLVRALPLLLGRRAHTADALRRVARRLHASQPAAARLTAGLLLTGAVVLAST